MFPLDPRAFSVKTPFMGSATLTIDLGALCANWRALDALTGSVLWNDRGINEGASFLANASASYTDGLVVAPGRISS